MFFSGWLLYSLLFLDPSTLQKKENYQSFSCRFEEKVIRKSEFNSVYYYETR